MRLRYPEGMRSVVDATLALQGPATAPIVSGTVNVKSASWTRGFDASGGLFSGLDRRRRARCPPIEGAGGRRRCRTCASTSGSSRRRTLRIDNDQARIVASADLNLRGTLDRPLLFGRAEIDRGEVEFEGRRYLVTRGSLDFANAESHPAVLRHRSRDARARAGPDLSRDAAHGRHHRAAAAGVHVGSAAAAARHPDAAVQRPGAERRHRAGRPAAVPNEREQRLVEARATRALTGALSEEVGRVVEQTFGVDTFQITPLLVRSVSAVGAPEPEPDARA